MKTGMKHFTNDLDSWVLELLAKGKSQVEISKITQASPATISRRVGRLRLRAKEKINEWATETLPAEFEKAVVALELVNRQAFEISENAQDQRTKLNALTLAKDANMSKIDLLSHVETIDRCISWSQGALSKINHTKQSLSTNNNQKELDQNNVNITTNEQVHEGTEEDITTKDSKC
jgi:Trp operon repressor